MASWLIYMKEATLTLTREYNWSDHTMTPKITNTDFKTDNRCAISHKGEVTVNTRKLIVNFVLPTAQISTQKQPLLYVAKALMQ